MVIEVRYYVCVTKYSTDSPIDKLGRHKIYSLPSYHVPEKHMIPNNMVFGP